MQEEAKGLPRYINMDEAYEKLQESESPFMKGVEWGIAANPPLGLGLDNPVGEGQNVEVLNPSRSNLPFPGALLPTGENLNIGWYESFTTQELYYFNFNEHGQHGIYVLNGNEFSWKKVIEDPELEFTDNPENYIAGHRVSLRIVYNKDKQIVEKILTITEGGSWQKWILVKTAIATNGFDASLFPYWTLKQPHFDRKELLQWATRPPMVNPIAVAIKNTDADKGKVNRIIDQAFQYCVRTGNTDGRITVPGSMSDPVIIKSEDFLNNPDFLPKSISIKFYAGSPLTEFVDIFVRKSAMKTQSIANTITWSDWRWVERVYKYGNDPNVLNTEYWKRTNPFAGKNYDPVYNTFDYIFDNSRQTEIIDQAEFERLENDIPQISIAQVILDDKLGLSNNRINYNNAPADLIAKLGIAVQQKETTTCETVLRKARLYAYIGEGLDGFSYCSQVGYFNGEDKQMRFGGINQGIQSGGKASINVDESKGFKLDFADRNAFRCYFKGTPFYADGVWYQVNADNTYVKIDGLLDITQNDVLIYLQNTFNAGGYFMCVFDFLVPAGRYIAAIGRHNVASSDDYRGQSTYVYGIANSRIKSQTLELTSIKPNALVSFSKEYEVDCTGGDIDPWGNGQDLFYIYCPYFTQQGNKRFAFIEGYLRESIDEPVPVELFPYTLNRAVDDWGRFTDKNGFYWAYTKINNAGAADVDFIAKFNCVYPRTLHTEANINGSGWKPGNINYLATYNSGQAGAANRVLIFGRMTNLDGTIGYSNIGISLKDGSTVYTDNNGNFTLIAHNGQNSFRTSNIYINADGNFRISIADCGQIPLFSYTDTIVACSVTPTGSNPCTGAILQSRTYPICISLKVNAEGGSVLSLKENSTYSVGFHGADLAGRLMAVNVIADAQVPSFLQTGKVAGSFLQLLINAALQINQSNPDIKWFAPCISPQLNIIRYLQWVGDKINYVNSAGSVVSDAASAAFVSIVIDSLYAYNVANNFSLLANWQFTSQDRVRILDNGEGQLFDVATFGEPMDFQILGTNYNQAALTAGIIVSSATNQIDNVNATAATTQNNNSITFYIKYDARLDALIKKTGFWIELYVPSLQTDRVPYSELKWYPVINGEVSEFTGFSGATPTYNRPSVLTLTYWDTYLFSRNISIPGDGNKFFNHAFASPNVSDSFGPKLNSGGRKNFRNDNARQVWKIGNSIKSDSYILNGFINGLGSFLNNSLNAVNYDNNSRGQILATLSQNNIVLFICENDFFATNYDFHYAFPNEQGVMVVNQDSGLSRPFQKSGDNFGLSPDETSTVFMLDKYVFWKDSKNEAFVQCDYRSAKDISDLEDKNGRKYGINSYMAEKTKFISNWNATHDISDRFDTIVGADLRTSRIYLTFRPRRGNSNNLLSYVNKRRNIDLRNQETLCYDLDVQRWVPGANFTPESYGILRGSKSGVEMITFAAGLPYYHLNTPNDDFLNYYGVQTSPVIIQVLNQTPEIVKTFMGIAQDILPNALRVDRVFSNEPNSHSYIPANMIEKKENVYYGAFLKDMSSYNSPVSTLVDGKRFFGRYLVVRYIGIEGKLNQYFQLASLYYLYSDSPSNKK